MKIRKFDNFDHLNEGSQGGGNKFILVRFGNTPDPRVTKAFAEGLAAANPKPIAFKGPGSVITMFETPKTKEALVQGFDALGITYNLYQVVHTSAGGTSPSLVARKPNKAQLKAAMDKAVAAENWEEAARLRDLIEAMEGTPSSAGPSGPTEGKVYSYSTFLYEKEEEEFVNGTNSQEFYKLVSELVDHEIKECEGGEEEEMGDICKKIKEYLVQNNLWVAPETEEGEEKKEGE